MENRRATERTQAPQSWVYPQSIPVPEKQEKEQPKLTLRVGFVVRIYTQLCQAKKPHVLYHGI